MSAGSKREWIAIAAAAVAALVYFSIEVSRRSRPPARELAPDTEPIDAPAPSSTLGVEAPPPLPDASVTPGAAGSGARPSAPVGDRSAAVGETTPAREPASVSGRVIDSAGNGIGGVEVLAVFATDEADRPPSRAAPRGARALVPLWKRRLPLDLADPSALGLPIPRATQTDSEGRFAFSACAPGRFRLALRAAGRAPLDLDDPILPSSTALRLPDIELEPGIAYSGRVLDALDHRLPGAIVARLDDFLDPTLPDLSARIAPFLAASDRDGSFATPALPFGRATLVFRSPSLAQLREDDPPELRLDLVSGLLVRYDAVYAKLSPGARIVGHVVSRAVDRGALRVAAIRAAAVPSAMTADCRADYRTASLESNGTFVLTGLLDGVAYELRAISPAQTFDIDCPWSPPVIASAGREEEVELQYRPDCTLTFLVEDARTHAPVPRFTATLHGATPEVQLDEHGDPLERHERGVARFAGVRPARGDARVKIEIEADGFHRTVQEEQLISGNDLDLGPILVDPYPTLDAIARDAGTRNPLSGVRILSIERDAAAEAELVVGDELTGASGTARIASLRTKVSTVLALRRGYAPLRLHGADIGGASDTCAIDLRRGVNLRVRVIDGAGQPIAGRRVESIAGEWNPNDARFVGESVSPEEPAAEITDAQGDCAFADLELGLHTFRVARDREWLDGEWKIVRLTEDGPRELVLVTSAPANVDGHVFDGKSPVPGVEILAARADLLPARAPFLEPGRPLPAGMRAITDSQGRFALRNLDPGPYRFVIRLPDQELRLVREARVETGDRSLVFDVGDSVIRGRVETAEGNPCPIAALWVLSRDEAERLETVKRRLMRGDESIDAGDALRGFPDDFDHPALVTSGGGGFTLRGLARNDGYTLYASDGTSASGWRDLSAARRSRDERSLSIRLAPRGTLRVSASAVVEKRALVLVALHSEVPPRIERLRPGLDLFLPALDAGTWRVHLFVKRGERDYVPILDPREVTIAAGEDAAIELVLP
jgi:protocatechuate 3,4-dioxygenase beta subunit